MVHVTRLGDWFIITNSNGGFGRFTVSADSESIWVKDVWGKRIMDDIYQYTRELGRQLGLNTKADLHNPRLITWFKWKARHDPTLTYDPVTGVVTGVN